MVDNNVPRRLDLFQLAAFYNIILVYIIHTLDGSMIANSFFFNIC